MNTKDMYYRAMKRDNGTRNEVALGETIGLDEQETTRIISMLLLEYKIEFVAHGACNYKTIKK